MISKTTFGTIYGWHLQQFTSTAHQILQLIRAHVSMHCRQWLAYFNWRRCSVGFLDLYRCVCHSFSFSQTLDQSRNQVMCIHGRKSRFLERNLAEDIRFPWSPDYLNQVICWHVYLRCMFIGESLLEPWNSSQFPVLSPSAISELY